MKIVNDVDFHVVIYEGVGKKRIVNLITTLKEEYKGDSFAVGLLIFYLNGI
jgi:hypothetical protein